MTAFDPNADQRKLIENTDGIYLVNAGAGTGKTFTITRRYAAILDQPEIEPDDILLATFTRNAAAEMADRIAQYSAYDPVQLQDAPISTFHGYCYRLLRRYGYPTPQQLGIDDQLSQSVELIEDETRESSLFSQFISRFEDDHPAYHELFASIENPTSLRSLIAELAAKGVIPTQDGWYRESESVLTGDKAAFMEIAEQQNEPTEGAYGPNQSAARRSLRGWDDAEYVPSAPASETFLNELTVETAVLEAAFDEDRTQLLAFVHDVYYAYLEYAIQRNFLTQNLMLALAFVMLCEDDAVRTNVAHRYVMVDEFQDTNEIQFKLSLLLAADNNLCAVGDWKQSIYGFQYTDIENIQSFKQRLQQFNADLNADRERIPYSVTDVTEIPLRQNYRSTDSILSLASETLTVAATTADEVDVTSIESNYTPLAATNYVDNSEIHAYTHEDEHKLIVDRIEHIVGNSAYQVETTTEPAETPTMSAAAAEAAERDRLGEPSYGDIAVFSRNRAFARELLETATEYGIPIAYEGGIELFDTDQAKLLLAWLRIVETDSDRGWATVLEEAGYRLADTEAILQRQEFPTEMIAFRETLAEYETIGGFVRHVLAAYGYDGAYADGLVTELTAMHDTTLATRSEAISYIESHLDAGTTVEIDTNPGEDSVTLQTIHSAKGLEYPIVILANMNQRAFPSYGQPSSSTIQYIDPIGLRKRTQYSTASGQPHRYSHWPSELLSAVLPASYDEERRLFYVAVTRAKRHLVLTAGDSPSQFFTEFPIPPDSVEPAIEKGSQPTDTTDAFSISPPERQTPRRLSVHAIMDDSVYDDVSAGRGTAFGNQVHEFAEAYADGESVTPQSTDEEVLASMLDGLDGEFLTEITAILPFDGTPQLTLVGIVDLLVETAEAVQIIDYKTDRSRHAEAEYRKQLSVYYHIASEWYPDKEITARIFYTGDDQFVDIEPIDPKTLRELAAEQV